ncbi:hypothetical protein K3495_g13093 [Podosphaera aphanis]|nr:hypothetical protein K3495_g13093 [Podosphaera aphanis]
MAQVEVWHLEWRRAMVNVLEELEPQTCNGAQSSPDRDSWNIVFEAEMLSFQEMHVRKIVLRPTGCKIKRIDLGEIERFKKAGSVAKGFSHVHEKLETETA